MSAIKRLLRIAPTVAAISCAPGPIVWEDSTTVGVVQSPEFIVRGSPLPSPSLPTFPGQCPSSLQFAVTENRVWHAAWWSQRADSTADIVASSSVDGRTWSPPTRLDTADVAKIGCNRPAPGVAANGGNFYVVYAMRAGEGPGIFLSHSMDGARTFHSPVAVVYGERPGLASVAAMGNFVVVAFEDPNSTPTRISVAVSNTMAHLFEFRSTISPEDVAATRPYVRLFGDRVELTWHRAGADSTQRIVRRGTAPGVGK